jgi:hypothetical protein
MLKLTAFQAPAAQEIWDILMLATEAVRSFCGGEMLQKYAKFMFELLHVGNLKEYRRNCAPPPWQALRGEVVWALEPIGRDDLHKHFLFCRISKVCFSKLEKYQLAGEQDLQPI